MEGGAVNDGSIMIAVLVLLAVPVAIVATLVAGVRVRDRDVRWLVGGSATPAEARVVELYLRRHRAHRLGGGLVGIALAVIVGLRWYGQAGFALGTTTPLADVLFCGVAGVVVGALSAETYRLGLPRGGAAVASLAPRPPLPMAGLAQVARALLAGSAVLSLVVGLLWHRWGGLLATACAAVVIAVAEATRRAVAYRRRPVLSERAQVIDGRLRGFAATTVTRLELSIAALAAMWAVSSLPVQVGPWYAVVGVGWLAALVVAVVQLRRAVPRPPAGFERATAPR